MPENGNKGQRFYFIHRGKFIRVQTRDDSLLRIKFKGQPWEYSTPDDLAKVLSGSQLMHVFENSTSREERRKVMAALEAKFRWVISELPC